MTYKLLLLCTILIPYTIKSHNWFDILPLKEIMKKNPAIHYQKCFDKVLFDYEPFSIIPSFPHSAYFAESFILTIPNGIIESQVGCVMINNSCIQEMIWANALSTLSSLKPIDANQVWYVPGNVAVLQQAHADSYCHWLHEILGRLALLEIYKVPYDWICMPTHKPFMKEILTLWGIDTKKILYSSGAAFWIKADQLIIPSMIINMNIGFKNHLGLYVNPYTIHYVKNKLLRAVKKQNLNTDKFCKKVFISRKDAPYRKIANEDEIFALFQACGFERYQLSKMSVTEQILLFNNAEIIVGEHGAGLVNIMFCKAETRVIEIFQALIDSSYWYLAHTCNLKYTAIKTVDFIEAHMTDWSNFMDDYIKAWQTCATVPLENIIKITKDL